MGARHAPVLAQRDPVGMGAHLHRAAEGAGLDRILVVVEAHEAQVFDTEACPAWTPSQGPRQGTGLACSASNTSRTVLPGICGRDRILARAMHWSSRQSASSALLLTRTRTRGQNSRSRIVPTWFPTCPFSQPEAGVQASGSTREWLHICRKRRLQARPLPTKTLSTAVFVRPGLGPMAARPHCHRSHACRRPCRKRAGARF